MFDAYKVEVAACILEQPFPIVDISLFTIERRQHGQIGTSLVECQHMITEAESRRHKTLVQIPKTFHSPSGCLIAWLGHARFLYQNTSAILQRWNQVL